MNSVEFNYRLDANYHVDLSDDLQGFANASLGHTGNRASPFNALVEPYDLVNAIIGVRKDPFEISVFANNLLDERGPVNVGFAPTGGISATPRTIGVRLRVNYQ